VRIKLKDLSKPRILLGLLCMMGLAIGLYFVVFACAIGTAILPLLHRPNMEHPPVYPNALQVHESQGVDDEDRPYKELAFQTNDPPTAVLLYYDRALQEDGWLGTGSGWLTPSATNVYTLTTEWQQNPNGGTYHVFLDVRPKPNNQTSVTLRVSKPPLPYQTPTSGK
jgi:hypothetical protein